MTHESKTINLALQGGGSHGAFTWGVLDRLLEEDRLVIEGVSGCSAGAMNAAMLVAGTVQDGRKGARHALNEFWSRIGAMGSVASPRSPFDMVTGNWNIDESPGMAALDLWQRMLSPYQTNPLNFNPLRDVLDDLLDVSAVRACSSIKLFISATNVETGRIRVFDRENVTLDAVLASACLPFAFQAVEIDGVPYWDGGYTGNPALFPLIYKCGSQDIAVVQINPLTRPGTPDTPSEIINRINEISFNASLISEMRAIAFVQKLVEQDHLKGDEATRLKAMNMHVIAAEDAMRAMGAASKLNTEPAFLEHLKELGRGAADAWLTQNWASIGVRSSVDIRGMYL